MIYSSLLASVLLLAHSITPAVAHNGCNSSYYEGVKQCPELIDYTSQSVGNFQSPPPCNTDCKSHLLTFVNDCVVGDEYGPIDAPYTFSKDVVFYMYPILEVCDMLAEVPIFSETATTCAEVR